MLSKSRAAVFIAALASSAAMSQAATLATYDFTGMLGTEVSKTASSSVATVTAGAISRGAGLTPAAAGSSMSSTGFSTSASFSSSSTAYYTVAIGPAAGNSLNLDTLTVGLRRSGTGPANFALASSLDGFASVIQTANAPTTVSVPLSFTLPAAFDTLTSTTTFRLYGYGATAGTGTGRLENGTGGTGLVFAGSTSAIVTNTAPVVVDPAPQAVVFGSVVSNGAPFSASIGATDVDVADLLSLAVTPTAGISNIAITGGGASPQSFTVTGTVDYSLNGTTVLVPYTVSDGAGGTTTGTITLVITPEPASLAALAGVGTLILRRRK